MGRITRAYRTVLSLLSSELMTQVSAAPMLKPPIIRTNVLRMNINFRAALGLYDYISSFSGEGFTVSEREEVISPLSEQTTAEYSRLAYLNSLVAALTDTELRELLEKEYQAELEREKARRQKELESAIEALRERVRQSSMPEYEYMLMLQERCDSLKGAQAKLEEQTPLLEKLKADASCAQAASTALSRLQREFTKYKADSEQAMTVRAKAANELVKQRLELQSAEYEKKLNDVTEARALAAAHLDALKSEYGINDEDYTEKERFELLEREVNALCGLYDGQ